MVHDVAGPHDAPLVAVLLHPHPHFGGDRHHPFVEGTFRRLADRGFGALRFDFTAADPGVATDLVVDALDIAAGRWAEAVLVLAGYSFGAGVASRVDDPRVKGWFLVAPPSGMLSSATIALSPHPKRVVVPRRDQFSSLDAVGEATREWAGTDVVEVDDDHYLWNVIDDVVASAVEWIAGVPGRE